MHMQGKIPYENKNKSRVKISFANPSLTSTLTFKLFAGGLHLKKRKKIYIYLLLTIL